MSEATRRSDHRWWRDVAVLTLAAVPVLMLGLRPISDQDAFWHVLGGRHAWQTHQVVGPDPFGSFATRTWVQHEWLGEVVMAAAHAMGGWAGLAMLVTTLVTATFGLLVHTCRREAGLLPSVIVALVTLVGMSGSLGARPQLFSFVLLSVSHLAWRATVDDLRSRWWLVPLTWVWACVHGLWLAGVLLGFSYVLGMALDGRLRGRALWRMALVPTGSLVAAALTPIGPRLLAAPLTVNSYAYLVTEWDPPDVHLVPVATTMALVAVTAALLLRRDRPLPWPDVLAWLMAFGWMVLYSRTVSLAALLVAPLAARALQLSLPRSARETTRGPWLVAPVLVALLVGAAPLAHSVAATPRGVPLGLAAHIDALPRGTVVFNDDTYGGWLLLAHPSVRGVIDSRSEIYSTRYWEEWIAARAGMPGWEDFIERSGATAALLKDGTPLIRALTESGWRTVAHADGAQLLLRGPTQ